MRKLPITFFLLLLVSAVFSSVYSYMRTEDRINQDVRQALAKTLEQMPGDVIRPDTISCYRSLITISEVRDTAYIAMRTTVRDGRQETLLVAEAGCGMATVLMLSDQRLPGSMLLVSLLWLTGCYVWQRKHRDRFAMRGVVLGGLALCDGRFTDDKGQTIRLTPMQHDLMEMFFMADGHTLTKQAICDRLWPRKPDAHDTLYTLIRRLKPVVEAHGQLQIESDRGRSYTLKPKDIG